MFSLTIGIAAQPAYDPVRARDLLLGAVDCPDERLRQCRNELLAAIILRPNLVGAWEILGQTEYQLGRKKASWAAFHHYLSLQVVPSWTDDNLTRVRDDEQFPELKAAGLKVQQPIGSAQRHFQLAQTDLIPESVAFDAKTGAWFISSIHRSKIVRRSSEGKVSDFVAEGTPGVWAVFGLAIDTPRRRLWAVTAGIDNMRSFSAELDGQTALLEIDLGSDLDGDLMSGAVLARYGLDIAEGEEGHRLNDLTVAKDGTVYAADNWAPGGVYRLLPGAKKLERFGDLTFRSPQGLALSADQRHLFVADYAYGLTVLDTQSGTGRFVRDPEGFCVMGIDALERHGDSLIAVQNSYAPHRVLRLRLDSELSRVAEVEVLQSALPEYDEPTLGTIVGDTFYYVANSGWSHFEDGKILSQELQPPLILKLDL